MTIVLDGSEGEGGGQILRTALSLSLITGRPFEIQNLRANRKPSGLRPQHLACVRGAEAISGARSEGAEVGASALKFDPQPVKPGDYVLEVGTAGSTPLLFQCLFYPLALAGGGRLTLRGGTHLPHSPIHPYLTAVWLPALSRYGLNADLQLKAAGFYPQGGGELRAEVAAPSQAPLLVQLESRGTLLEADVASFVSGLPFEIAERQAAAAQAALQKKGVYSTAENIPLPSRISKGTAVFIRATFEHSVAGFSALGERGKPAEEVGQEAAAQLADFLASGGAIDEHLGDQILLPAALLSAGRLGERKGVTSFTTSRVTDHLTTNAAVVKQFLPEVEIEVGAAGAVAVVPKPPSAP